MEPVFNYCSLQYNENNTLKVVCFHRLEHVARTMTELTHDVCFVSVRMHHLSEMVQNEERRRKTNTTLIKVFTVFTVSSMGLDLCTNGCLTKLGCPKPSSHENGRINLDYFGVMTQETPKGQPRKNQEALASSSDLKANFLFTLADTGKRPFPRG